MPEFLHEATLTILGIKFIVPLIFFLLFATGVRYLVQDRDYEHWRNVGQFQLSRDAYIAQRYEELKKLWWYLLLFHVAYNVLRIFIKRL